VSTASYATLGSSYQRVHIPLSAFLNSSFDGTERVERLVIEGLPANGSSHVVELDNIVIERPDDQPPSVSVAVSGGTSFTAGSSVTATATASDAEVAIDFVEFFLHNERVGIDHSSPYSATFTMRPEGSYALTAIAYDMHGNPRRSSEIQLTSTAP